MAGLTFTYAYYNTDRESFAAHLDADAWDAAKQLTQSERGTKALRDLSELLANGAIGLDEHNQRALITLLVIAYRRPSATDNAIVAALSPAAPTGWSEIDTSHD